MSVAADGSAHRSSWLAKAMFGIVGLAVIGVLYASSAKSGGARRVVLGRRWPAAELVSIDRIDHRDWDRLLKRHVDAKGNVGYREWNETPADLLSLDAYLGELSRANPALAASRPARLAFWINAYNALTIRGILREYPTASIQDHRSRLWGFDIWRDLLLRVGDRDYSLGRIEHQLLRPLHEPRIHFAIVCGSRGCPRLRSGAYAPEELERQLDENARQFFADPQKLEFDRATGKLRLSPIMNWYADDFGSQRGEILKSIAPFLREDVARQLQDRRDVQIEYTDYDWSLNGADDAAHDDAPVPPDRAR